MKKDKYIHYSDSFGRSQKFAISSMKYLKKRKPKHVIGEVVELLDSIYKHCPVKEKATAKPKSIGFELNVNHSIVGYVFSCLEETNLVEKKDGPNFRILRPIEEKDYGAEIR